MDLYVIIALAWKREIDTSVEAAARCVIAVRQLFAVAVQNSQGGVDCGTAAAGLYFEDAALMCLAAAAISVLWFEAIKRLMFR